MKSKKNLKGPDKIVLKVIVSDKVRSYADDPFFIKKADRAKEMIDKYGLPEAITKRLNKRRKKGQL
jgi:hypothetical protein